MNHQNPTEVAAPEQNTARPEDQAHDIPGDPQAGTLPAVQPVEEEANAAASTEESFGAILSAFEKSHSEHKKDDGPPALEGRVIAVSGDNVFVDIGKKTEGIVPAANFRDPAGNVTLKPGDILLVNIKGRNEEGYYELSTIKVERPKDWSSLEKAFSDGAAIAGTVQEVIKGGLRIDVGVRAFMPASRSGARDQAEMERLIGQEIRCKIIKLDTAAEDVVVDRRAVLEQEEAKTKQAAFDALQENAVVRGKVRTLTDFGAFVDIGGVDGLLHVADLSWRRVGKPSDVLKTGDEVEVKILKINRQTKRISLGMKQLQPDPWTVAAEKYKIGERVTGKVSRLTDFGAFIELEPGVDGLVHLSELSWSKRVRKASDVVNAGDNVEVVVLGVNAGEHRISLGLKQALGDPWEEAQKKYPVGSTVEGPITNLANFGAFVDLGDGVEGMIHIGDISREKRLQHPKEMLAVGQKVRAAVLEFDAERRRIRLGMKQLEPTSFDEYLAEHKPGETVTGRVVEVNNNTAKVELGEGVYARCRIGGAESEKKTQEGASKLDLGAMTAMLSNKWKKGMDIPGAARSEGARAGEIRSFRIVSLDPSQKKIEIELAS